MWVFRRNKRDSVPLRTLVCQRTSKQSAGISSALPAASWAAPLCFRWDPEVIHTEAAQPLLSSRALGRAGILPGGALGSSLLPTPGGRQLPALPAEVSLVPPAQENDDGLKPIGRFNPRRCFAVSCAPLYVGTHAARRQRGHTFIFKRRTLEPLGKNILD